MDEQLALRLLRRIMQWGEEVATQEYAWVRLLAGLKYDGYGDYVAGVRFAESLAGWLAQFEQGDRQTAYDFVKHRLVYFSGGEVKRLVVELQSYEHHAHRQAFDRDYAKLGRLTLAGYQVLPLTDRQLKQERDWVVASPRALLRAARSAVPAPTL
jgi:hypothetical protein